MTTNTEATEEFWSYDENFLSKEEADKVLEWAKSQTVIEYPFRGKKLVRSPKLEWGTDATVGTYRWGQERSAYDLVGSPFPKCLDDIRLRLNDSSINHVILIRYDKGKKHHIPWHSDKQEGTKSAGAKDIRGGTSIYNVVVCDKPRVFQLAKASDIPDSENGHAEASKYAFNGPLQHGSLFTITAEGNALYKHRVPKSKEDNTRFSIVFRSMKSKEEQKPRKTKKGHLRVKL